LTGPVRRRCRKGGGQVGRPGVTPASPRPQEVIDEALERIKKDKIKLIGVDKISNLAEVHQGVSGFVMTNDLKTIYICSETWDNEFKVRIANFIEAARRFIGQGRFNQKAFDKLIGKAYYLDFTDLTARTIKHEYGHILSFARSQLSTGNWLVINQQYRKYLQILNRRGIVSPTGKDLYEIIAEDLRIAMGGKDAIIPSPYTWRSDLANPKLAQKARKELIRILGLRSF